MTRSLSVDIRGRVIAAIEDGVSTAGTWYRRYRTTGEMEARKQGQPSRSKLNAHEAFSGSLRRRRTSPLPRSGSPCRRARRAGGAFDGLAVPRPARRRGSG